MKHFVRGLVAVGGLGLLATTSCASQGFGGVRGGKRLIVELIKPADPAQPGGTGTREKPRPIAINTPQTFRIKVRAINVDGSPDTSFSRYVRISSKPGAIQPFASNEDTEGRNLVLRNGESAEVNVSMVNAYGTTFIVADDLGYTPADPLRKPPPACANGKDDDGDGTIDSPADEGCAFANDDSEETGTFTQGVSEPVFFALPRVADIRGLTCQPGLGCSSSGATPFPKEQILVGTGYDELSRVFGFNTLVSRIASDGFYIQDLGDTRAPVGDPKEGQGGFVGLFAFNFNPPPRMRVCDRVKTLGGTTSEFFGFTQLSYPTWTLEEWDPTVRRCLLPDGFRLKPGIISDTGNLLALSGSYVRVETADDKSLGAKVTPKFGPGDMKKVGVDMTTGEFVYQASADASNCDLNKDGKVDFTPKSEENGCAQSCTKDPECTEWSNYASRSTFRITVRDSNNLTVAVQADATTSALFNPVEMKGKPLRHFAGTLHYFSGGSQFTVEARCKDDIVAERTTNAKGPIAVGAASLEVEDGSIFEKGDRVRLSSVGDIAKTEVAEVTEVNGNKLLLRGPVTIAYVAGDWVSKVLPPALRSDFLCKDDKECPAQTDPNLPPIRCVPLDNGERACRWLRKIDPNGPEERPNIILRPPELACVTPRTIAENNPQ